MNLIELQGTVHTNLAIYALRKYRSSAIFANLFTPTSITAEQVHAAWANAVKYTASGVDLADHDAAIQRLLERHPSWHWIPQSTIPTISVKLSYADQDRAESEGETSFMPDYSTTYDTRLIQLKGYNVQYPNRPMPLPMLILLPGYTDSTQMARDAWSYAVRYSADALEAPNHDNAARLLLERHPSWAVIKSDVDAIKVELKHADADTPEASA